MPLQNGNAAGSCFVFCFVLFLPETFIPEPSKIMSVCCSDMHFSGPASRQASPLFSPGDIGGLAWWGQIWTRVARTSTGSYFSRTLRGVRGSLPLRRLPGCLETRKRVQLELWGPWTEPLFTGEQVRGEPGDAISVSSLGTIHVCWGEGSRDPVRSDSPVTNEFRSKSTL